MVQAMAAKAILLLVLLFSAPGFAQEGTKTRDTSSGESFEIWGKDKSGKPKKLNTDEASELLKENISYQKKTKIEEAYEELLRRISEVRKKQPLFSMYDYESRKGKFEPVMYRAEIQPIVVAEGETTEARREKQTKPVTPTPDGQQIGLSVAALAFFGLALVLEVAVMFRTEAGWGSEATKIVGLTLILGSGVFLITAGYSQGQITPMVGLLGTVAGYLMGQTTRPTKTPDRPSSEVSGPPARPAATGPTPPKVTGPSA